MSITLRAIVESDAEFLYLVYASTREAEMALLAWSPAEIEAFLRMQFRAQHAYYQENFGNASFDLILEDGAPIGRLYLDLRSDEMRIIDIALLPEHRRRGIGSALMRDILDDAARKALPVRIHVERNNPALGLYRRLGFTEIEDQGVYWLMEWRPGRLCIPSET